MNTSFELNNARKDDIQVKDQMKFNKVVEICSALFNGSDVDKYGKEKDAVVTKIKDLGTRADNGDWRARAEINTIVKFMVQPKLLESLKVFSFLGDYKEVGYDVQPVVKTYNYEGLDARMQASNSDVSFGTRNWIEYPITTRTISAGMAIDYRELASGNFGGNVAEETAHVQVDMNNKAVAYALSILNKAVKENTKYVKFFSEYASTPTQTLVDAMVGRVRKLGKVAISGDFSVLSAICDWNGYKTIGTDIIPYYTQEQVSEIAKSGLNGFYKGSSLVELPNPYNFTKPLSDKSAFETYYDADKLYFTAQGTNSPFHIFRRGGINTMTGNDIETGMVKTRFDIEIGADVTKGREFEIGIIAKQA
jgi:hypothetical protein